MTEEIIVTCAIIHHPLQRDRFLIDQRLHTSRFEQDRWEFPGGKLDDGETLEECLIREIHEELAIGIRIEGKFMAHIHRYSSPYERIVHLHTYDAEWISGEVCPIECQDTRWVTVDELEGYDFVAGDHPIIRRLKSDRC